MQHPLITKILQELNAKDLLQEAQKRLDEEEKLRLYFYNEIIAFEKAEFILGEIIRNPVHTFEHNETISSLFTLLQNYVIHNNLGQVFLDKTLIHLARNEYKPDICFFNSEKVDQFKFDQNRFPAPDFIVEVLSESTAERDRGIKMQDYEAHQIAEYWIIDAEEQFIEQYILKNGQYEFYQKLREGEIESFAIEKFRIPVKAIFDEQINRETLGKLFS